MSRRSSHTSLLARLEAIAWGRRLESGMVLVATAARASLVRAFGGDIATALLVILALAALSWEPARRFVFELDARERTERRCGRAFDAAGIELLAAPTIRGERSTPAGVVYDLGLSPRLTGPDLAKLTEPLAVAFGAARVEVRRDRAWAGHGELVVSYRDTLAEPAVTWPWVGMDRVDLWGGLPLGYDEEGGLVTMELAGHHLLLGGEPGAGKSNALSLTVGAAALDPSVELWCFDGKLVELASWRRCARRFVGPDLDQAAAVLKELRGEMDARYAWILDRGLRQIDASSGRSLVLLVIDELALYVQGRSKGRDAVVEILRDIVARGRAAGIVVVAATQKPASDVVPTSIRDLFGYRLALRCATRDASDTVLGVGWSAAGFSAAEIDPATRGVGFLLAQGTEPRRMRCFVLSDEHLGLVARQAERLRGLSP